MGDLRPFPGHQRSGRGHRRQARLFDQRLAGRSSEGSSNCPSNRSEATARAFSTRKAGAGRRVFKDVEAFAHRLAAEVFFGLMRTGLTSAPAAGAPESSRAKTPNGSPRRRELQLDSDGTQLRRGSPAGEGQAGGIFGAGLAVDHPPAAGAFGFGGKLEAVAGFEWRGPSARPEKMEEGFFGPGLVPAPLDGRVRDRSGLSG